MQTVKLISANVNFLDTVNVNHYRIQANHILFLTDQLPTNDLHSYAFVNAVASYAALH